MANIVQGRIVYALDEIPDPQGHNSKSGRPFVILSTPDEIANGGDLFVVAVSRDVYGKDEEVALPWGDNCNTGLRSQSAAMCNWTISLSRDRVDVSKGIIPPAHLREILQKVAR